MLKNWFKKPVMPEYIKQRLLKPDHAEIKYYKKIIKKDF